MTWHSIYMDMFVCLFWGLTCLLNSSSVISRRHTHEKSYSAATLERSCEKKHMTVTLSADGGPTSHISQHSSVSKGATGTIFYDFKYGTAVDQTHSRPYHKPTLYPWDTAAGQS